MRGQNIAGLSMKGGRRDQFFFCLLQFFPEKERWFLSNLLQVKDNTGLNGDEATQKWITNHGVDKLIVDFPLTTPPCYHCQLSCPGIEDCPEPSMKEVRRQVQTILREDEEARRKAPKKYERDRNQDDLFDFKRDMMAKESNSYILSRPFKRRLKKGFLPYWNRALDFWVWSHYYDQLLQVFNISFDSFGDTSFMTQSRFRYLQRHFPSHLKLSEAYIPIILIELLRSQVLFKKDIQNLYDMDLVFQGRLDTIRKIENSQRIFVYHSDLELLCQNSRAFDSFLLAVAGQRDFLGGSLPLPSWSKAPGDSFIVPQFS